MSYTEIKNRLIPLLDIFYSLTIEEKCSDEGISLRKWINDLDNQLKTIERQIPFKSLPTGNYKQSLP